MKLLDTTLRDGSYVINFGFSAEQTSELASALDDASVPFIEVGHGVGLNASLNGQGRAKETDQAYMRAAADAVKKGKWGMFAIPGICDISHIDSCIDHNIGFLRFGVSVDRVYDVAPFVEKAKSAGIFTAVNFMKSYVISPAEFEKIARQASDYGADAVYVVDSAGNMTPQKVRGYLERIQDLSTGFHAHNNLGLAVANAIVAEEMGAAIIDTSLQGMGRCTGNTATEQFVAVMQREGKLADIDLFALMDASEELVRPLLSQIGHDTVDLACGVAGFHSSYMGVVKKYSLEYDVDPRRLIMEICKETQAEAPAQLVRAKAEMLRRKSEESGFKHRFPLNKYFGHEEADLAEKVTTDDSQRP